jgi:gamma-glutamylcyclotransferase
MATATSRTVYFGYGSNLWLQQMVHRCPTSHYLGVARLKGYRWTISSRGYANIIEFPETDNAIRHAPVSDQVYDNFKQRTDATDLEPRHNHTDIETADFVYGLVYSLTQTDEHNLDRNEGVPIAYTKEHLPVDFWAMDINAKKPQWTDVNGKFTNKTMLVYIDRQRTDDSYPKKVYIYR